MGASTPHRKAVRMWPNASCSICLVSALMWIGRVVVLQPESSNHAPIHATISPPILPCVHIAEDLWAPPLELWARPPVLTPVPCRCTHSSKRLLTTTSIPEYRCPAHPSISGACFAPRHEHCCLSGPWCLAFRIVVNRRTHSIKCIVTSKTIFAHATATGTNQQSRPQVHLNLNHTWTDSVWSSAIP